MSAIKNVTIAGGSGSLGSVVLQRLVASNKFNITVLRRQGSSSTFPQGTKVIDVDFADAEALKSALTGQDAVISTAASAAIESQIPLIDAAIAAGVKRYIPSDFGSNLDNEKCRKLPVYMTKVKVQDYLHEKVKSTSLTCTTVYNAAFLDWGLEHGFVLQLQSPNPILIDGGDITFSSTALSTVGDAVVGILTHPEETKNRTVYIEDIKLTQNKVLAWAREVAPEKTWEPKTISLDESTAKSDARLAQGLYDMETFVPYLWRSLMDPSYGGNFEKTDNELLGIKGKTEADVKELIKKLL